MIDKEEFIENYMHIDKYYLVQSLYNDRRELDKYKQENKKLKSIIKTLIKEFDLEPSEYVEILLKGDSNV